MAFFDSQAQGAWDKRGSIQKKHTREEEYV